MAAFKQFAALPIASGQLSDDPMSDGLLFEFGTFDFGGKWGKTFEVAFVRQFGMRNGDLQQVHLVIHFPPPVFEQLRKNIGTRACSPGAADCIAACAYQGTASFLGTPCILSLARSGVADLRPLIDAHAWSFDTQGNGSAAKRRSWIRFVESSALFQLVLSRRLQPLGFEVWRDSAD